MTRLVQPGYRLLGAALLALAAVLAWIGGLQHGAAAQGNIPVDPIIVLDSVELIDATDGEADSTVDTAQLWTGANLPVLTASRQTFVDNQTPIVRTGTQFSIDWQIFSLTTGALIESTYTIYPDGSLPVYTIGDGELPSALEAALVGRPIESDYVLVYPLGMTDLPSSLPTGDAFLVYVQVYQYLVSDDGGYPSTPGYPSSPANTPTPTPMATPTQIVPAPTSVVPSPTSVVAAATRNVVTVVATPPAVVSARAYGFGTSVGVVETRDTTGLTSVPALAHTGGFDASMLLLASLSLFVGGSLLLMSERRRADGASG